ncbi:hypothetical protein oki674_09170 [Helicobacter pylori]
MKSQMQICNNTAGCSASMNTSYSQMPVEFGFRSNFSKHSGIEVGFKLPLFTNQFYKERGVDGSVDVFYKKKELLYLFQLHGQLLSLSLLSNGGFSLCWFLFSFFAVFVLLCWGG